MFIIPVSAMVCFQLCDFHIHSCTLKLVETIPVQLHQEKPSLQVPKLERVWAAEFTKQWRPLHCATTWHQYMSLELAWLGRLSMQRSTKTSAMRTAPTRPPALMRSVGLLQNLVSPCYSSEYKSSVGRCVSLGLKGMSMSSFRSEQGSFRIVLMRWAGKPGWMRTFWVCSWSYCVHTPQRTKS